MVDWYSRDTKIINFNWEVFYAEPGYEGKINGHCNGYWLPLNYLSTTRRSKEETRLKFQWQGSGRLDRVL